MNIHTLGHGAGFLLDQNNKIGYCENPKVGTSTWMNYFSWLLPLEKRKIFDDAKEAVRVSMVMRNAVWKHFMVEHTRSFNNFSMSAVETNFDNILQLDKWYIPFLTFKGALKLARRV